MSHPSVNLAAAAEQAQRVVAQVIATQTGNIRQAAELIAHALANDGIIQAFGTGHSRAIALELAGRAGGLVPAHQLWVKDLVMYGKSEPEEILDPLVERDPDLARRILDLAEIHPADVFVIASQSGGNGSIVEMAILAKERGHQVVAITSHEHSSNITSRHESGKKLYELADIVIDNCGPYGDATLPLPTGGATAPTSTISSALIVQMLVSEICGILLEAGETPPVMVSMNTPEGDRHNAALVDRYGDRIRLGEP